jgi:phosphatidylglycerol---prolipoprotein diacylglyceryl transferase
MCSELVRIPLVLNGVPIFGFGVLLAVWLAFSAWGIATTAKAAGWSAALRAHLPTALIIAAAIALFIPRYFPDGVPIRGYGVMVLAGSVAGIALAVYRARQAGLPAEEIMGLAVAMFILGIIGARLFYVLEYWHERIRKDDWLSTLKAALSFTEGGLVVYGAFIGAMLGFALYVRRRRLPALAIADMIAAGMVVGLAFGRIGCLLNGCCYGGESSVPWVVSFPVDSPPYYDQARTGRFYGFNLSETSHDGSAVVTWVDEGTPAAQAGIKKGDVVSEINGRSNSLLEPITMDSGKVKHPPIVEALKQRKALQLRIDGTLKQIKAIGFPERSLPVHPTQIYSAITATLLAGILWAYYPLRRRDGEVLALMITLYPVARFFEEMIRVDEPSVFGTGLSISQNISVLLFIGALAMWAWLLRQPRHLALGS